MGQRPAEKEHETMDPPDLARRLPAPTDRALGLFSIYPVVGARTVQYISDDWFLMHKGDAHTAVLVTL